MTHCISPHLFAIKSSWNHIYSSLPSVMNHAMLCKCVVSYMLFDKQACKLTLPVFQEEGWGVHVPIWKEELAEKLVVWICGPCVIFGSRLAADKLHPTLKAAQVAAARSRYKKLWSVQTLHSSLGSEQEVTQTLPVLWMICQPQIWVSASHATLSVVQKWMQSSSWSNQTQN